MRGVLKKVAVLSTGLILLASIAGLIVANTPRVSAQDCDSNAVISCGVTSTDALKLKYIQNTGNVQAIYSVFGIHSVNDFDGMVMGSVAGNGNVFVGNTLVANNALTAGRVNFPGSTPIAGGIAFERPPSVSFKDPNGSLSAFIKMNGNQFQFAVIESCGNPVNATSVTPPTPPPPKIPNFTVNKQVRLHGDVTWQKAVTANEGQVVDFRIIVANTGQTTLTNTKVTDTLPNDLMFVDNTLVLNGQGMSGGFSGQNLSINIGSIAVGQQATIIFDAHVSTTADDCGAASMVNTAVAQPMGLNAKSSQAIVQVCKQTPPPVTSPPATPAVQAAATTIPNTGSGNILGVFMITAAGAAIWHQLFLRLMRRFSLR